MKGAAGPEARAAEGPRPLPALGTRAAASAASGLGAKPPSCSGAPALGRRGPALPAGLFHRSDPSHLSFGPKPAEPLGHHRGVTGAGRRASASGGVSLPPPASPAPGPLHSLPGAAQSAQLGLSVTPPLASQKPRDPVWLGSTPSSLLPRSLSKGWLQEGGASSRQRGRLAQQPPYVYPLLPPQPAGHEGGGGPHLPGSPHSAPSALGRSSERSPAGPGPPRW